MVKGRPEKVMGVLVGERNSFRERGEGGGKREVLYFLLDFCGGEREREERESRTLPLTSWVKLNGVRVRRIRPFLPPPCPLSFVLSLTLELSCYHRSLAAALAGHLSVNR